MLPHHWVGVRPLKSDICLCIHSFLIYHIFSFPSHPIPTRDQTMQQEGQEWHCWHFLTYHWQTSVIFCNISTTIIPVLKRPDLLSLNSYFPVAPILIYVLKSQILQFLIMVKCLMKENYYEVLWCSRNALAWKLQMWSIMFDSFRENVICEVEIIFPH